MVSSDFPNPREVPPSDFLNPEDGPPLFDLLSDGPGERRLLLYAPLPSVGLEVPLRLRDEPDESDLGIGFF